MAKTDSKDQAFGSLLKQAINTDVKAPMQKVVEIKAEEPKTKFTFHLPTDKYNKLKILAVKKSTPDNKVFLNDLINQALDLAYFKDKK